MVWHVAQHHNLRLWYQDVLLILRCIGHYVYLNDYVYIYSPLNLGSLWKFIILDQWTSFDPFLLFLVHYVTFYSLLDLHIPVSMASFFLLYRVLKFPHQQSLVYHFRTFHGNTHIVHYLANIYWPPNTYH